MTLTYATKSIKVKVISPEAHCSSATRSELGSLDLLVESDTLGNGVPAGRNLYLPTRSMDVPKQAFLTTFSSTTRNCWNC